MNGKEESTVTFYIDNHTGSKLPIALFDGPLIESKSQHVCIKLDTDVQVVEKLKKVFKKEYLPNINPQP